MSTVTASAIVPVTAEEVFTFIADYRNIPRLQPHFASLEMTFYEGKQFPAEYRGDIFAAEHGSWNRKRRTGYEVIRVPLKNGHATGEYEDFLTGFVTQDGKVWGRPVGVTVGNDGALYVTDDGSNSIWRVSYAGK